MNEAIIICNGKSRLLIDLTKISQLTKRISFGCNAIYREIDFERSGFPNHIVAIDAAMIKEIEEACSKKVTPHSIIIPPEQECWEPQEMYPGSSFLPRGNAGISAMREAIKRGCDDLLIIGFDSLLIDPAQAISNVYEGTSCYGNDTRCSLSDTRRRLNYLVWVVDKNPNVDFKFVFPEEFSSFIPSSPNSHRINITEFMEII